MFKIAQRSRLLFLLAGLLVLWGTIQPLGAPAWASPARSQASLPLSLRSSSRGRLTASSAGPEWLTPFQQEADGPLTRGFGSALTGMRLMAISGCISAAVSPGNLGFLFTAVQRVPSFLVAGVVFRVMASAARRDRLNGGTFKVMSLAILAAFVPIVFLSVFDVYKVMQNALSAGGWSASSIASTAHFASGIIAALSASRTSYGALQAHGMPKFKLTIKSEAGPLLTFVAVSYAITAINQVIRGGITLLYSEELKVVAALRCFIVAASAHVCQTAAVVGPKRLSSETYRLLNIALVLDSAIRIAAIVALPASVAGPLSGRVLYLVWPALALFTSGTGWIIGKLAAK